MYLLSITVLFCISSFIYCTVGFPVFIIFLPFIFYLIHQRFFALFSHTSVCLLASLLVGLFVLYSLAVICCFHLFVFNPLFTKRLLLFSIFLFVLVCSLASLLIFWLVRVIHLLLFHLTFTCTFFCPCFCYSSHSFCFFLVLLVFSFIIVTFIWMSQVLLLL